ncbi:MAG: hypothetical protein A3G49_00585 [Candidatus Sungbacteria bacterium RIFCSPLOWO2_12_FULL_41_11]|uniref:N-acetyltransferase domain-containing protein n=1 Tax=Candidatus Sungbacteria bacterium RIFCSPLOWO2_12_FULL_41_11 TaxID=1802286 RepID=A0A1G2LQ21_9BACT|nr:MAG: GCN5-related N-acetyltransferase [Parcubacteria group bacterium GW2011_GWA2_42_14]OHA12979.1 MAG: hypothetical protein A3G49_00585 [Candidatus Sungbacteria bacterium RIFCSPLOWO2_12_FULL_41_11]
MLKGKKVRLRAIDPKKDAELFMEWINDYEVVRFLGGPFMPLTKDEERKRLKELKERRDTFKIFAVETLDGALIGSISLMNINHLDGTAVTGTLIGDKDYWRKGYATDAKMILLYYAFQVLNLRRISTRIIADNIGSIRVQEKCGYEREGIWRKEVYADGKYRDMVLMAVFRGGYMKLWRQYQKKSE